MVSDQYSIRAETGGNRLDRFLALHFPRVSRSRLQWLVRNGFVKVNDLTLKPSSLLKAGDLVDVVLPVPEPIGLFPEEIPLDVVYQDSDLMVVEKPPGLAVHPGPGHPKHTLVNALMSLCDNLSSVGGDLRPGIVHRLDKDTSGLMVVAKNDRSHKNLAFQLKERTVSKRYLALVTGNPASTTGVIEARLARDPIHRKRFSVSLNGRDAVTHYVVKDSLQGFSLLEVTPVTGRTHQIRVHLSSIGHPIVGDSVYNRRKVTFLRRQFLHASFLSFDHPSSGHLMEFVSELPYDLRQALEIAGS